MKEKEGGGEEVGGKVVPREGRMGEKAGERILAGWESESESGTTTGPPGLHTLAYTSIQ
jgi:hypothetical protein